MRSSGSFWQVNMRPWVIKTVVIDVLEVGDGKILHGDACTYHNVTCTVLCYMPELHEIVEGTVVEVVEFGCFVRLGPSDALVHVSQICDDFIQFENMSQRFLGKESNKILTVDDVVRGRVIAVSMGSGRSGKLGLTMRAPFLGKIEWINDRRFHHSIERDHEGNLLVPAVIEASIESIPIPLRNDGPNRGPHLRSPRGRLRTRCSRRDRPGCSWCPRMGNRRRSRRPARP